MFGDCPPSLTLRYPRPVQLVSPGEEIPRIDPGPWPPIIDENSASTSPISAEVKEANWSLAGWADLALACRNVPEAARLIEKRAAIYRLRSLANDTRSSSSIAAARYPRLRYPASRLTAIFASIGSFSST